VTTALLVFVIFLSLKNTPLAILTSYSYERLNFFHRVAGYSLIGFTMAHTVVMLVAVSLQRLKSTSFYPFVTQLTILQWARVKDLSEFLLLKNVYGIVAGSAMLVILATVLVLRKSQYETFHIIHITMVALILITAAMHRPDIPMVGKIVALAASLWIADRTFRLLKLAFYGLGNTATITPLPYGGTRIVMRKSPIRAVPGAHCFLWIPGVRSTESHPFTILSTSPFEMVIAAYDGFTRDLHTKAMENPGQVLRASVDGPYGTVPDFTLYSKVLFIAGGSGASFTCGAAVDLLRKLGRSTATAIEFVWVMKEQGKSRDSKDLRRPHANIRQNELNGLPRNSKNSLPHLV
jgi:predicted ferric reductase